jgi:hypothetical protein
MIVVNNDELVSVSNAGPLSSIDKSIDCTVSETAENGTMRNLRRMSIKWQAVREFDTDVAARDALCHADIQ